MSNPETYNPELPENINARNEAHDINEMVDMVSLQIDHTDIAQMNNIRVNLCQGSV